MNKARRWTHAQTKAWTEATLVSVEEDSCTLRKPDGTELSLNISDLSEEDQAYLKQCLEAKQGVGGVGEFDVSEGSLRHVVLTDVRIPFGRMVMIIVKWAFASIPAVLLVWLIIALVMMILAGAGGGILQMFGQ